MGAPSLLLWLVGADVPIGPNEITGAERGDEDIAPYLLPYHYP